MGPGGEVGLVLAGGGARGAYEVGALSVLLPALDRQGWRPSILVGTSVGGINAVSLGASRHMEVGPALDVALARWRELTKDRVVRPMLSGRALLGVAHLARRLLWRSSHHRPGLVDTGPLASSLRQWIDWDHLHANLGTGLARSVAVVATAAPSGRSVAFVEGHLERSGHRSHVIDYVPARLSEVHVRASAAIPMLFPPVRVEEPDEARGWYFDGGTRLNTPIKPALDLGAGRLVVVGTEAVTEPPTHPGRHESEPPDAGGGALHLVQGALVVDQLIDDLRRLGDVNRFFAGGKEAPAAQRYRQARGKSPYRTVPYIYVGPRRRGQIGEVAIEVLRANYGGRKALRSPDLALLDRLLGEETPGHGELLSYLLLDPDFVEELIGLGRQDARAWIDARPAADPWQVGPLEAFMAGGPGAGAPPQPA